MLYELLEYAIHRCLHSHASKRHSVHHSKHSTPRSYRYTAPGALRGAVGVALSGAALALGTRCTSFIVVYGLASVLSYRVCHLGAHMFPNSLVGRYHQTHHSHTRFNFGVGSPLGDVLGGTLHPNFAVRSYWFMCLPAPFAFLGLKEHVVGTSG